MPTALNLLRNGATYMPQAFTDGLQAYGFKVVRQLRDPSPGDLLLIWNRYGDYENVARRYESVGGTVVVVENGYYGRDEKGHRKYALSIGQHHKGGAKVRDMWVHNFERRKGKHLLICAQRGIGSASMASPNDWHSDLAARLESMTKREVRVRKHPGKDAPSFPLSYDLDNCHACFIWSSACGVEALVRGVPVVYAAPHWIAQDSATHISAMRDVESIPHLDSEPGLNKAFSNQWTLKQIQTGEAFAALLGGL